MKSGKKWLYSGINFCVGN
ncbi:MAG: hypothetical protein EHM72_03295 [Calditrichaeota bacterium]|nr:MAG: hypothetical protein EHM72_20315 [Calditrichota bacterium]RPI02789.1 MAG: hypothetical protein EHM72_03295 [Calditrichota bacterium]